MSCMHVRMPYATLLCSKLDPCSRKVLLEGDLGLPTRLASRSRRNLAVVGARIHEQRVELESIVFKGR